MGDDPVPIDSVVVEPAYCHRCGSELEALADARGDQKWCSSCERILARTPVPGLQVVVRDGDRVLLLDEPSTPDGLWTLPGGHASHHEPPRTAAVRELEEETGLHVAPGDLSRLTVAHVETPAVAFYLQRRQRRIVGRADAGRRGRSPRVPARHGRARRARPDTRLRTRAHPEGVRRLSRSPETGSRSEPRRQRDLPNTRL